MWNGELLDHWGDVLAAELVQIFDPVEVWLFGSVARGDDNGDSDLDVLVVLDQYDANQVIALKRLAIHTASIPAPFDISFSSPERMVQRGEIAGTIERAVRLDGVLKYRRA
jgi:predicted nucleotidyltransferase